MTAKAYKLPAELLDLLPNFLPGEGDGAVHIPQLPLPDNATILCGELDPKEVLSDERRRRVEVKSNSIAPGRNDNAVWVDLRPRHWPLFNQIRENCDSWRVYKLEKERLLKSGRGLQQMRKPKRQHHDYDILADVQHTATPLYRLVVME